MICVVEREWQAVDARRFGIGNISLAEGVKYGKHGAHKDGLQMDIRALRKDGQHLGVTRFDRQYDQEATAKLIAIVQAHPSVMGILFNDSHIPGVKPWIDHDDHFHVAIRAVI